MPSARAQLTPHQATRRMIATDRGSFAALEAAPTAAAARGAAMAARGTALLLPGFTGSKEDFAPVFGALTAAGYRVVSVDQRGQHETPGADSYGAYLPDALAQDVLAVAAQLPRPIHLVGHSFGGLVARAAVLAAPGAFASLTLMSTGPGALVGWRREMIDALEPVLAEGGHEAVFAGMQQFAAAAAASGAAAAASGAAASSNDEQADRQLLSFLRRRFLATDAGSLRGMGGALRVEPDRVEDLRACAPKMPMMVLYGDGDDAWPSAVQADMARRLGAREVVLAGVGHSPCIEEPQRTTTALTAFWSST